MKIEKINSREYSCSKFDEKGTLISGPKSSFLLIKFTGDEVCEEFLNCIRRVILNYIPTFAFCKDTIDVIKNTSNVNDDVIKLNISLLPIFDIPLDICYLKNEYYTNIDNKNNDNKHKKDAIDIKMFIKMSNTSDKIVNVMTDDAEVYINDKLTKIYDKTDHIMITQLVQNSELVCQAKAVIGVGFVNDIWCSGMCHYYDEDNSFKMMIKSGGQYSEIDLLKKVCINVYKKLKYFKRKIKNLNINNADKQYVIVFDNEDHTYASLINYFIQSDENVVSAGLTKENFDDNTITFKFITNKSTVVDIFDLAIDKSIKMFNIFESLINDI